MQLSTFDRRLEETHAAIPAFSITVEEPTTPIPAESPPTDTDFLTNSPHRSNSEAEFGFNLRNYLTEAKIQRMADAKQRLDVWGT